MGIAREGVDQANILKVYSNIVRPVLENVVPKWQAIPGSLSDTIESVQNRVFKIIFPVAETCSEAFWLA